MTDSVKKQNNLPETAEPGGLRKKRVLLAAAAAVVVVDQQKDDDDEEQPAAIDVVKQVFQAHYVSTSFIIPIV